MDTSIWNALIGAAATLAVALIGWMMSRQDRTDTRTNVARDLEILKALNPGSPIFASLKDRVNKNISRLIEKQDRQDSLRSLYQQYFSLVAFLILSLGAGWASEQSWATDGLGSTFSFVKWTFSAVAAVLGIGLLWNFLKLLGIILQIGWGFLRIGWGRIRIRVLESKLRKEKRKSKELAQQAELSLGYLPDIRASVAQGPRAMRP